MPSSLQRKTPGKIVSLDDHRTPSMFRSAKEKATPVTTDNSPALPEMHFKLIDFLHSLEFEASVEVDDLSWIGAQFSVRIRDHVVESVKKLLCQEFGKKRVFRTGMLFKVQHRDVERLMENLMEVQVYVNQILLPEYNVLGEQVGRGGVSISWGVGRNGREAQQERLKQRQQKNLLR